MFTRKIRISEEEWNRPRPATEDARSLTMFEEMASTAKNQLKTRDFMREAEIGKEIVGDKREWVDSYKWTKILPKYSELTIVRGKHEIEVSYHAGGQLVDNMWINTIQEADYDRKEFFRIIGRFMGLLSEDFSPAPKKADSVFVDTLDEPNEEPHVKKTISLRDVKWLKARNKPSQRPIVAPYNPPVVQKKEETVVKPQKPQKPQRPMSTREYLQKKLLEDQKRWQEERKARNAKCRAQGDSWGIG